MSVTTDSRTDDTLLASPRATRATGRRWRDPRLAVGAALVAGSGLLGALLLGTGPTGVQVWATRTALTAGAPVTLGDLEPRTVTVDDPGLLERYLDADQSPAGLTARHDVGAGELLPRSAVGTGAPELVELPLAVPPESVPATVGVGSTVDVWVTPDPELAAVSDRSTAGAELVLRSVPVLALSRAGGALGPGPTRQVVVGLDDTAQDALPAALTRLAGGSVVLVRQP